MTHQIYKLNSDTETQYQNLLAEIGDAEFNGWNAAKINKAFERFAREGVEAVQTVQIPIVSPRTGRTSSPKLTVYVSRDTLQLIVETGVRIASCHDDNVARGMVHKFVKEYTTAFYNRFRAMNDAQKKAIRTQTAEESIPKSFLNYENGESTKPNLLVWEAFFLNAGTNNRYASMRESLEVLLGFRDRMLEIEEAKRQVHSAIYALEEHKNQLEEEIKRLRMNVAHVTTGARRVIEDTVTAHLYGDDAGQHAIVEDDGMDFEFAA